MWEGYFDEILIEINLKNSRNYIHTRSSDKISVISTFSQSSQKKKKQASKRSRSVVYFNGWFSNSMIQCHHLIGFQWQLYIIQVVPDYFSKPTAEIKISRLLKWTRGA